MREIIKSTRLMPLQLFVCSASNAETRMLLALLSFLFTTIHYSSYALAQDGSWLELKYVREVSQPATLEELIRNLKVIVEDDLLIDQEFYTRTALLRFFGGSKYAGDWPDPKWTDPRFLQIEIWDFERVCPPWRTGAGGAPIAGLSITIRRNLENSERKWAELDLTVRDTCPLSFQKVTEAFGSRWAFEPRSVAPPHERRSDLANPAASHAYEEISYDFSSSGVQRHLLFSFQHDGLLEWAKISIKR